MRYADPDPSGLAALIGGLIEGNLARDPSRVRLLRPGSVCVASPADGAAITVRTASGAALVIEGADPAAGVRITTDAARLVALTTVPLRLGFPDAVAADGRTALRDVFAGRIRIAGMMRHPIVLARFTMLLSAR